MKGNTELQMTAGKSKGSGGKTQLNVLIRSSVKRAFMRHIGPGRLLSHAVEQALLNEIRRGSEKEVA